ncbi:MAG: hypothetical protein FK731_00355 [Asgard group archaeon]|nr:hypothetical protein [Asgard group archaeon]
MNKKILRKLSLIVFLSTILFIIPNNSKIELAISAQPSEGMKVLFLLSDMFYKEGTINMEKPAFEELGFTVETAAETATIDDDYNNPFDVDLLFTEVDIADYVAIHIPCGTADNELTTHPFALTTNQDAMDIVNDAYASDKIMIASGDGPVVYAEADIISGKNITCWPTAESTVTTAGANYIPEGFPIVDDQFITYYDAIYTFRGLMDFLKMLGIHETDPPVIDNLTVEIITATDPGSINITVEVSDAFGTEFVYLIISKYDSTASQYEKLSNTTMPGNDDNTIFNSIRSNLEFGNYSIGIQTIDLLENSGYYEDQFEFYVTSIIGSPLVTTLVIIGSSIFIIVIIRRKKSN